MHNALATSCQSVCVLQLLYRRLLFAVTAILTVRYSVIPFACIMQIQLCSKHIKCVKGSCQDEEATCDHAALMCVCVSVLNIIIYPRAHDLWDRTWRSGCSYVGLLLLLLLLVLLVLLVLSVCQLLVATLVIAYFIGLAFCLTRPVPISYLAFQRHKSTLNDAALDAICESCKWNSIASKYLILWKLKLQAISLPITQGYPITLCKNYAKKNQKSQYLPTKKSKTA